MKYTPRNKQKAVLIFYHPDGGLPFWYYQRRQGIVISPLNQPEKKNKEMNSEIINEEKSAAANLFPLRFYSERSNSATQRHLR
ncbi:hypothetical protein [Pantoea agglomerans]|uniref:hypothetical protein n=1 Tax=Enterobacter agglomerans TaxID=549 RepID=UPI001269F43F|nr:hypothetical protein [Pantoea agglomerans]